MGVVGSVRSRKLKCDLGRVITCRLRPTRRWPGGQGGRPGLLARDGRLWIQQRRSVPGLQLWPRGVTLIVAQGQTACTEFMETIVRGRVLEPVARLGMCSMCVGGWSLGRGEGRLEVPFGRFLEAMVTLDLALDLDVQGDWQCHLGRLSAKFKIKPRSRRSEPASQGRAKWSSRPYGALVLDVGVTEDLSRRATGLRLVSW